MNLNLEKHECSVTTWALWHYAETRREFLDRMLDKVLDETDKKLCRYWIRDFDATIAVLARLGYSPERIPVYRLDGDALVKVEL